MTNGYALLDDIEQAFVRLVRRFSATWLLTPVEIAILHPQHVEAFAGAGRSVAGGAPSVNGHTAATQPAVATPS